MNCCRRQRVNVEPVRIPKAAQELAQGSVTPCSGDTQELQLPTGSVESARYSSTQSNLEPSPGSWSSQKDPSTNSTMAPSSESSRTPSGRSGADQHSGRYSRRGICSAGSQDRDNMSEVPTIDESVADMTDFNDLSSLPSHSSVVTSSHHRSMCQRANTASLSGASHLDHQSDVPTIDESVADMQELESLTSSCRCFLDETSNASAQAQAMTLLNQQPLRDDVVIDARPHPLGVVTTEPVTSSKPASLSSYLANTNEADIGGISDIQSLTGSYRDDMSVASAPSEICVELTQDIQSASSTGDGGTRSRMKRSTSRNNSYHREHRGSRDSPIWRSSRSSRNYTPSTTQR